MTIDPRTVKMVEGFIIVISKNVSKFFYLLRQHLSYKVRCRIRIEKITLNSLMQASKIFWDGSLKKEQLSPRRRHSDQPWLGLTKLDSDPELRS